MNVKELKLLLESCRDNSKVLIKYDLDYFLESNNIEFEEVKYYSETEDNESYLVFKIC